MRWLLQSPATPRISGKAAGVHSTAKAVDFFHADATLNAEFGNGTDDVGTITGEIHNIMSGGRSVTESIELLVADPGPGAPMDNIRPRWLVQR